MIFLPTVRIGNNQKNILSFFIKFYCYNFSVKNNNIALLN